MRYALKVPKDVTRIALNLIHGANMTQPSSDEHVDANRYGVYYLSAENTDEFNITYFSTKNEHFVQKIGSWARGRGGRLEVA